MKIDLTCPVELWQYVTPTPENPECTFVFNNLSDRVVISIQTTLVCYGQQEQLMFRQVERIQGLIAGAGERFSAAVVPTQWEGMQSIDLVIEKVWFDDATIWRRGNAPLTEYHSNTLHAGRQLDQLRFVAGLDAVGYPTEQSHVWVCVCGRANGLHADRCCRCARKRETVFATCSQQNVDQLIAVHEQKLKDVAYAAREDASRLAEEREKARISENKKKRNLRRFAISTACVVALAFSALLWGLPALHYAQAGTLLRNGQYDEARATYAQLGSYADAQTMLLECDYRKAASLAQKADEAGLSQAAALYQALGDYLDSAALYQQTLYQVGETAIAAQHYETAADAFQALMGYQDSADRLNESQYLQADKLLQSESYIAARILFDDLGAYMDSAARVGECDYYLGKNALEQSDYATAVEKFASAGDTLDAVALLKQARYQLAEQMRLTGDLEQAGRLYLQAGDYSDAALKANNTLYELAGEARDSGDYAKAAELYQSIEPYLDSETQNWECVYQQAIAAADSGNDEQATLLLAAIPKHAKGQELLKACRYRMAAKYLADGKTDRAVELFELLGDYQDSALQLRKLRYQLAESAFTAADYETAAPLYEALGKYQDSVEKLKQSRYALATAALNAKNYRGAIEGFSALGNYQDSKTQLESATFALALDLKTSGDTDAAVALLESLADNSEAKQQLSDITLSEAAKLQAAGELEKASALYLALGDYGTAKENYQACQYALAKQSMQSEDYRTAAALFATIADYQDAATLAAQCNYEAYDRFAVPARAAYETKAWKTVIDTLQGFNATNLPADYQDLSGMYEEACYNYAEELYDAGKVYEALPYYQLIPEYKDVATKKLQRRSYLILGVWESVDGERSAVFRSDSTCTLFGEDLYFSVDGYALKTGATLETLSATHKLTTLTQTALSIRVLADGRNIVYPLQRVATDSLATESPQTTPSAVAAATPAPTEPDAAITIEPVDSTAMPIAIVTLAPLSTHAATTTDSATPTTTSTVTPT